LEQALRIKPGLAEAEAHSNLGAIFQRMGKLPEAVAQYEQALRSKPDYVKAHFNLGLALEKLGRTPEAIEHYQQALRLRPDLAAARNALARLQARQ
jgi:tetratricopeptide (TPR) repeat protein